MNKSVNKRKFTFLVAKRINNTIHYAHVASVLSIFIDEFIPELQKKEKIDIPNFCSFRIERTKPRKYHNINKGRFAISSGKFLLKIKISKKLRKKIIENIDLVKTFI